MVVALAACGHPAAPRVTPNAPRLHAPRPVDPAARGAAYLTAVALQLQPGWGQFLDDCRLRLPADHRLNDMGLAATAELSVDVRGRITIARIASSGNRDFDRAVNDAMVDASAPPPPVELLSDDDKVHLQWLFARDSRQAGPATAKVLDVEQPLAQVIPRWIQRGELARAARRVARAPEGADRSAAARVVMDAALAEAAASSDPIVAREATDALARARGVSPERESENHERILRRCHRDAATDRDGGVARIARGLDDRDATVRAACISAVLALPADRRVVSLTSGVRALTGDRDVAVRARAVAALVELDPTHAVRATIDASRDVREAYAGALRGHLDHADLAADANTLADDRDPLVRTLAWSVLADAPASIADARAIARALADPASSVRLFAAGLTSDEAALERLAASDDDMQVRAEALVRLAQLRGRGAVEADLLTRVAAAPPASTERVRAALAWLLAR